MIKSIHSRKYEIAVDMLKQRRVDAGISQIELAERLDATQTFVSRCERKERRLDLLESYQFCEAIGVDFVEYAMDLKQRIQKESR